MPVLNPTAARSGSVLRDLRSIHRLEYPFPIVYACHVLWGACFAVSSPRELWSAPVLVAMVANVIGIISQNPLNAALDFVGDTHTAGKERIAGASRRLTPAVGLVCAAVEKSTALGLSAWIAVWLHRPLVAIAVLLAILSHLAYNLEPVRLKRRGYLNPAYFGATFAFLPALSTYVAVRADVPLIAWVYFLGLGVLLFGRSLWWSIPDLIGDRRANDRTPAVRHGPRHALVVACGWTGVALVLIGIAFWRFGVGWAVPAVLAGGAFLADKLVLLPRISERHLPHESAMRKRGLSLSTAADILLCLIPLIAA